MAKKKARKKRRVTRKPKTGARKKRVSTKKATVRKRRVGVVKKKVARKRRKKRVPPPKVIKAVERVSVERTLAGRKRKRRAKPRKKVSGRSTRRRTVTGKGSGLLVGLAIGVGAYLLLQNMNRQPTTTQTGGLTSQLQQTSNPTRNSQSADLINYAIAAGLAYDLIDKLIDRFNDSSDAELKQIYDNVNTTGNIGVYV